MTDWIIIAGCIAALGLYEMYLRWMTRRTPLKMARSAHAEIRSNWVKSVMSRPGTEVLVIQTLRNSVMAASFMATTAVLALSGTLTLAGIGSAGNTLLRAARDGDAGSLVLAVKLLLLAGTFFLSFLFMAMAVRFFNHAGYLITGEAASDVVSRNQVMAIAYMNRAGHHYGLGLRAFFTCIPLLAGLFSTWLMLPATAVLLVVLFLFDRIPIDEQSLKD